MGPNATGREVDGSEKKLVFSFLQKLAEDDTLPGLHIEPINGVVDDRVRTGRVNTFWRAILFKVQGAGDSAYYVFAGVLPHDEATAFAKRARLGINPVNGIAELILESAPVAPEPVRPEPLAAPVVAAPVAPVALLVGYGIDRETLVDRIGISPDVADRALLVSSDDELIALAESAVQWQGLVLLDLAAGTPVSEALEKIGIAPGPDEQKPLSDKDDDDVLVALQHPAAQLQFAFIEDDEELRRAIEESSFSAWRIFLHPEQRRYATGSWNGPYRLSGGAGTGKTVVLLHRARNIARRNPGARILLTTYTKTLAEALRTDLRRLDPELRIAESIGDPGIWIGGVDAAVHAVLKTLTPKESGDAVVAVLGQRSSQITAPRTKDSAWRDAALTSTAPAELRTLSFLQSEYASVVLPERITDRDAYLTVRRPGRGVPLNRRTRDAVWQMIAAYRARASIDGSVDFTEAAAIAAVALEARTEKSVDHALVDEGQDLTPSHWQFLRSLAAVGRDDLFISEDSHQRIYGHPVVLGRLGIGIRGRARRLTLNYRTTAENLGYALGVLRGADFVDLEESGAGIEGLRSARSGPQPRVLRCAGLGEELDAAATVLREWISVDGDEGRLTRPVGLLVRDAQQARRLSVGLDERGIGVRTIDQGTSVSDTSRPLIMTMHRAKGMEFSRVLIFGVDEGLVPADYLLRDVPEADRVDAVLRERSLLYVAATRARDELVITTDGQGSSLLP